MTRNVKIVLLVSVLFGASTGIYEFVLPYYLQERGVTPQAMGAIFAAAGVGMLVLRIVMGRLADRWGRKLFYGISLAGSSVAIWLTSAFGSGLSQGALKTLREAMFLTRDTVHPIVLYEESRGKFMRWLGKTRGFEYLFQAGGTVISGLTLTGAVVLGVALPALGTGGNLRLAAVLTGVGFFLFLGRLPRALGAAGDGGADERVGGGARVAFFRSASQSESARRLPAHLQHRFEHESLVRDDALFPGQVRRLQGTHRRGDGAASRTIAVPLLLISGTLVKRHLRAAYIWTLAVEGAIISVAALIPNFYAAAGVWLLHDLLGSGVWTPIQGYIIQEHTRPETRALEMGKVLAFGSIGTIIGPLLSGYLYQRNLNAPFIASGLLMIVAAFVLYGLRMEQVEATVGAAR